MPCVLALRAAPPMYLAVCLICAFVGRQPAAAHRLHFEETLQADRTNAAVEEANTDELSPMKGFYTTSKYEYDPLTRFGGDVTDTQLIISLLEDAAQANPNKLALRQPHQDAKGFLIKKFWGAHTYKYRKFTWKEYRDHVMAAAAAFVKMGLKPMDAVNIRGINSPEWLISFLGCIAAGGLPVGLYPTDSDETLEFKAKDSGAKFIVVGKAKDLAVYAEFLDKPELASVETVILWDVNPQHPAPVDDAITARLQKGKRKLLRWDEFIATGFSIDAEPFQKTVQERISATKPGQAASVVYTSGTTGTPKGVMLSQDAVTWSAKQITDTIITKKPPGGEMRIISYLPLNHIAGQMLDIIGPLKLSSKQGMYATIFFPSQCYLKRVPECFKGQLADAQPTLFLGVPEVWDGLKANIETATKNPVLGFVKGVAPRVVLKGVGLSKVMYAISGAGPISAATLGFFHKMGLNILNAFGQSESSAVGTGWTNAYFDSYSVTEKFGSIGKAIGNEVAFKDVGAAEPSSNSTEGEIVLRGRNLMLGYLNKLEKTEDAFTPGGWLKTGDRGRIDGDGFVFLTGRLKEIFKDHGGEMIAPVAVEQGIKEACNPPGNQILKQVIVVGDGKYYISALITLVEGLKEGFPTGDLKLGAENVDPDITTVKEAMNSTKWDSKLRECIGEYNVAAVKAQQRVYRYAILPADITAESSPDLMTPTFKIKREGVATRYADVIETCGGDAALSDRSVKKCGAD